MRILFLNTCDLNLLSVVPLILRYLGVVISGMSGEVIDRNVDTLPLLQPFQTTLQEIKIECIWMIKVEVGFQCRLPLFCI